MNDEKLNQINEIAGYRCSAAFSKILNKETGVIFSHPVIINVKELPISIEQEELGVGIYLPITGGSFGSSLLLFSKESAAVLCSLMMKKNPQITQEISSFDEAILKELGNILLGNYLTVFSNSLKIEVIEGMPEFFSDKFDVILEEFIADFAGDSPKALVIKIEFMLGFLKRKGYFFLLFRPERIEILVNAL